MPRIYKVGWTIFARVHSGRFLSMQHAFARVLLFGERPPTCCVIGSSPHVLRNATVGEILDSACLVTIRANFAPTRGYEQYVGSRTDVRVMAHTWVPFDNKEDSLILHRYRSSKYLKEDKLANINYSVRVDRLYAYLLEHTNSLCSKHPTAPLAMLCRSRV